MKFSLAGKKEDQKQTQVGLWITQDTVAIAKITREGNERPSLRSCDYRQFSDDSEIAGILEDFCNLYYLTGKSLISVLGSHQYRLFLIDSPEIEEEHLADALQWRVKDLVEFPIDEAAVDAIPVPILPQQSVNKEKMAYVVVAQKKVVDGLADLLDAQNFFLQAMDIPELVVRNALAFYPEVPLHVAFLNIMPKWVQLDLIQNSNVYMTRTMDMDLFSFLSGGEEGTTIVTEGKPIVQSGWDWSNSGKLGMRTLDDLGLEIQRSFEYCVSEYQQEKIQKIYMNPIAEYGEVISRFLERYLEVEVKMIAAEDFIDCKTQFPLSVQERSFLAICAALRGVL